MFQLLLAVIYLAFISLGLPDSLLGSAWPTMYREFSVPVSYAGGISMIIAVGTIVSSLLSDRLPKRCRKDHRCQCFHDCSCTIRIFHKPYIYRALSVGRSLWSRRRMRRCGTQQLCCASLYKPPYELAALYVGSRRFSWPLYYGIRIIKRTQLEYGIPLYFHSSDPADGRTAVQPAPLEKANCSCQKQSYCCVISRTGAFSLSDCSDFRCKRNHDHVFLLLCSGTDNRTLGQQLSGFTLGAYF